MASTSTDRARLSSGAELRRLRHDARIQGTFKVWHNELLSHLRAQSDLRDTVNGVITHQTLATKLKALPEDLKLLKDTRPRDVKQLPTTAKFLNLRIYLNQKGEYENAQAKIHDILIKLLDAPLRP